MGVIDGGQDAYINTTLNSIGKRAGNADLVAVVLALKKARGLNRKYHFGMPVHLLKAWHISKYASY
jgi:citrate (Re)-synthase